MEIEPGPVKKMKMKTEECGNPIDMDEMWRQEDEYNLKLVSVFERLASMPTSRPEKSKDNSPSWTLNV